MFKIENEIEKILNFINEYVEDDEIVVIPVSGGIDSDVTARLCVKALGKNRVKLFIVEENQLEEKFINNAIQLSKDLDISLIKISLNGKSEELIKILEKSDKDNIFNPSSILEIGKVKVSYRTSIISCYQDKGYIIVGSINRTEYELGFFVTFGDYLANLNPIEHLYKHEVIELAKNIGTRENVINEKPSAGFWKNQEDLEDIAYWIVNEGPILNHRTFSNDEIQKVENIKKELSWEKIDKCLLMIRENIKLKEIQEITKLSKDVIIGINKIVEKAKKYKNRKILVSLR